MYMFNLTLQSVHYSPKTEKSPSDYPTSSELTGDKASENEKPKVIPARVCCPKQTKGIGMAAI